MQRTVFGEHVAWKRGGRCSSYGWKVAKDVIADDWFANPLNSAVCSCSSRDYSGVQYKRRRTNSSCWTSSVLVSTSWSTEHIAYWQV